MSRHTDDELRARSAVTLVESWRCLAAGSPGARIVEQDEIAVAVFVREPDRRIYNNAVMAIGAHDPGAALRAAAATYAEADVEQYAVWVHASDEAAARVVRAAGYEHDTSTLVMGMDVDDMTDVDTSWLTLSAPDYHEFLRINKLPAGLLPQLGDAGRIHLASLDGENVVTALAFDHDGDCGIYNVATVEHARRRGLGTALTAYAVAQARERGCTTATLQSTEMAERVYAAVGFRDLGRYHEYVPSR